MAPIASWLVVISADFTHFRQAALGSTIRRPPASAMTFDVFFVRGGPEIVSDQITNEGSWRAQSQSHRLAETLLSSSGALGLGLARPAPPLGVESRRGHSPR